MMHQLSLLYFLNVKRELTCILILQYAVLVFSKLNCTKTEQGSYPFFAMIEHFGYHICAGSVVNDRSVLSLSSCLDQHRKAEELKVVFGGGLWPKEGRGINRTRFVQKVHLNINYLAAKKRGKVSEEFSMIEIKETEHPIIPMKISSLRPAIIQQFISGIITKQTSCFSLGYGLHEKSTSYDRYFGQIDLRAVEYKLSSLRKFVPFSNDYCYQEPGSLKIFPDYGAPIFCNDTVIGLYYRTRMKEPAIKVLDEGIFSDEYFIGAVMDIDYMPRIVVPPEPMLNLTSNATLTLPSIYAYYFFFIYSIAHNKFGKHLL
ncbi:uncharacterized protein LOC106664803 [Cimex lectularius]|uniref:Peptidase S1 domain-containing protein n=1 Tax=Cimex lectularius TaxID=79782 RepID=A0A8I6RIX3_CIMLE|nr:uncharacterized protein LOC106664803 [Cimex lectularius]XP_024082866.1 uncharacterized protein LOC106664803 [Cimex lectularius]XP_024082867.1 uncharacterized protein LOC106664803 [Cimex lectularius]XP_024082868.1 uncharacterized protein LOC106664803 [Cimex lectularius]XP_024082869.1 uncharacterized protein LOC106664803 [Cimex lectularius]XP_024082870.1 uncharacterized protein LOC106664803 [Cimex lectularius]XP_024082871.1 uncharacterized protein LOC106664803 [Cimex lectularius]